MTPKRASLAAVAVIHIGRGLRIILDADPVNPDDAVLAELIPRGVHGWAWLILGLAILGLWRHQRGAWSLATIAPSLTAISYLWAVLMWAVPGPPPGATDAIGLTLVWGGITWWAAANARWPDHDPRCT